MGTWEINWAWHGQIGPILSKWALKNCRGPYNLPTQRRLQIKLPSHSELFADSDFSVIKIMENSSNLTSLAEDEPQNGETASHSESKLPSAFSSKPDRPPTQYVLQHFFRFSPIFFDKFSPVYDWTDGSYYYSLRLLMSCFCFPFCILLELLWH